MKSLTITERLGLAREVFEACRLGAESFREDNIGASLSYLMGAILDNLQPGFMFFHDRESDDEVFLKLLLELFEPHHRVWQFVEILGDDGESLPHPEITLKMLVAGHDANGKPDIWFGRLKTTEGDVKNGFHYDQAIALAKADGYEGSFVPMDEDDAPQSLLDLFDWSSPTITHIRPLTKVLVLF